MESIVLLAVLVLLIMLGAPVGFTLLLIPVVYILITDAAPMILIPSQMFSAIDSVPLTAIPFFMLTGELMTSATITDRLVELSKRLIGRMRGSLAQANVLVSLFFAGMNGSVVADTAMVGSLLVPAMKLPVIRRLCGRHFRRQLNNRWDHPTIDHDDRAGKCGRHICWFTFCRRQPPQHYDRRPVDGRHLSLPDAIILSVAKKPSALRRSPLLAISPPLPYLF